jgi:hypothetical protein
VHQGACVRYGHMFGLYTSGNIQWYKSLTLLLVRCSLRNVIRVVIIVEVAIRSHNGPVFYEPVMVILVMSGGNQS